MTLVLDDLLLEAGYVAAFLALTLFSGPFSALWGLILIGVWIDFYRKCLLYRRRIEVAQSWADAANKNQGDAHFAIAA